MKKLLKFFLCLLVSLSLVNIMPNIVYAEGEETIDHDYDQVVTKAATCTEDGIKTYTCSVCGDTYTETIPATGHSYDYDKPIWTWSDDYSTATVAFKCEDCDDIQTLEARVTSETTAATCIEAGKTTYTAVTTASNGNTYVSIESETIPATGHNYDNGTVTTAPTCTTDGVMTYTCSSCGDTYTEVIPATGHTYGDPTFTWSEDYSIATVTFICAKCNDTKNVDATVTSQTTDATCIKDGETVYTATVTLDGQTYIDTKTVTIAATGHSYDEGVVTKEATETETGIKTYTCSVCGDTYTETIPALGTDDDPKLSVVTTNPTGTTNSDQSGNSSSTVSETDIVQTSDNTEIIIYASMMGIAFLACILALSKKKRKTE